MLAAQGELGHLEQGPEFGMDVIRPTVAAPLWGAPFYRLPIPRLGAHLKGETRAGWTRVRPGAAQSTRSRRRS
jgi:hypothetical protein